MEDDIFLRSLGYFKEAYPARVNQTIESKRAGKKLWIKDNVAFVGGVAKNPGIKAALEKELNIKLYVPAEPQITGALGAALYV